MKIKPGASIKGLRPEMVLACSIIDSLFIEAAIEFVITEGTGGKHGPGSLHYVGLAIDVRSRDIPGQVLPTLLADMKENLGAEFDVVMETDHIHVEFQPK